MKQIEIVRQTRAWNCGAACLAMVTGRPIETIEDKFLERRAGALRDEQSDPPQIGITSYEMQAVLWDLNILHLYLSVPGTAGCKGEGWYDRVGRDMPVLRHLDRIVQHLNRDHVAILGVDSLRGPDKHWIVAHGSRLLDPIATPGPRYESMFDYRGEGKSPLAVAEAILLNQQDLNRVLGRHGNPG